MGFENIQVKECWRKCGANLISPLAYVKLHIISVKLQLTGKSSLTYQFLEVASMVASWWTVAFLRSVLIHASHKHCCGFTFLIWKTTSFHLKTMTHGHKLKTTTAMS